MRIHAEIERLLPLLRGARVVVLTTHVNPDGDGLGSVLALATAFRSVGIRAEIINHSPTPFVYRFLDPDSSIRVFAAERDDPVIAEADLILVVDTNHPDRLRSMERSLLASRATKVCIDHHLDPAPFAAHYLVDDDATSTGEIVYHLLIRWLGAPLSPPIATALYCAIMTDTGSFRYPRVDPEIHRIVAHLIECGADPVAIYSQVYERWSGGRLQLLGEMLAGLKLNAGGRVASVAVTRDMLRRTGTDEEDTDNFTVYPMSVEGVVAGMLFLELPDGVKISFRSRGDIPINELAKEFGGNGHKNAAGARVEGTDLDSLRRAVLKATEKYLPPMEPEAC
jgi:bifunctional oligoribonuclease and PAP phosphatase NrnA